MKNISFKTAKNDIIAGIIVALVSIPISMGYAQIAGLPAAYGLYGSLIPVLIYAFTTTSPQFVFGVDATPAVLVGGTLSALGVTSGSEEAMKLVPVITFVVAIWLLIFSLIKAGRIVNYISTPVMGGFISGIGITIILMQVPKLFGGSAGTGELIELGIHIWGQLQYFNVLSAVLGFGTVVIILVAKKYIPKFPMSVVLMVLGAMATAFLHIDRLGVKLLPHVDSGFPKLMVPDFTLLKTDTSDIIILGLTCALVIMAQTLLATNNYANRYGYKVDNNREVLAYSLANIASSVSGSCPLNGSVSRTGIADQFGCKSQLMSVTASITMLVVVLFATPVLEYLPVPILTGIVVAALIGIVEYKLADKLRKVNRAEFFIFLAAMFGVLLFGTIYGVIIGVILSFIAVIIRAVVPPRSFLGCIPGHEGFYNLNRNKNALQIEHTLLYRFSGNLFFANVSTFLQDIENAINDDTKIIIVDASGIGSIDITAADRLAMLYKSLKEKGIRFYMTEHIAKVNEQIRTLGLGYMIEEGRVRRTIHIALKDMGIARPYPLEGGIENEERSASRKRADNKVQEFVWAFGAESEEQIEKQIVLQIQQLKKTGDIEKLFHGSWSHMDAFDEDEWLEHLEEHLKEIVNISGKDEKSIATRFEEHRKEIHERIKNEHPEMAERFKKRRHILDEHLRQRHPEVFNLIEHLRESDDSN